MIIVRRRAMALSYTIENLGLEIEDLGIRVVDDLATVSGRVSDQATKERFVLALGITAGIGRVDDQIEVEAAEPIMRRMDRVKMVGMVGEVNGLILSNSQRVSRIVPRRSVRGKPVGSGMLESRT